MIKTIFKYIVTIQLFCLSIANADIYMYSDQDGVKHFVNYPVENGTLVKRTSSISTDSEAVENVQIVLSTPRFSRDVTMSTGFVDFRGEFPRPKSYLPEGLTPSYLLVPDSESVLLASTELRRSQFNDYIETVAKKYNLQPALLHAVITVESAYNPRAISHAGAKGLMQLMPAAAARFGVQNPYDPVENLHGGAQYLRYLIDYFGDVSLALAGYNAGEGSVQKYGNKIPPFRETQNYVPKVLQYYQKYRVEGY